MIEPSEMNSSPQNPMLRCKSFECPPRCLREAAATAIQSSGSRRNRANYIFPAVADLKRSGQAGHVPVHLEITDDPEQMPSPIDVEQLLAAASSRLGPSDAATLAQASARMYSWARAIPGAATASAREGAELVGFGYGYSWDWTSMTDAWSLRLRDRLAGSAGVLDDSFSVVLLVVAPDHRRSGLGARLLAGLAE